MKLATFYVHLLEAANESGRPLTDICDEARASGIEAVDLMYGELTNKALSNYQSYGFALSGVPVWFDFAHKPFSTADLAFLDVLRRAGAERVMLLPTRFTPEDDREALMPQILDGTAAVAEACMEAGIQPTMEIFDSDTVPFHTVEDMHRFLDAAPSLGMTIDTGNIFWTDADLLEVYSMFRSRVNYIHAKDFSPVPFHGERKRASRGGREFYGCPIGAGMIPIRSLFRELVRDGYNGTVVIELYGVHKLESALVASANFLRDEWKQAVEAVKKDA